MKPACRDCSFFDAFEGMGGTAGRCRRHPPSLDMIPILDDEEQAEELPDGVVALTVGLNQTDITRRGVWPEVTGDDWCGEFQSPYA